MKVSVVGAGNMASSFVKAGHDARIIGRDARKAADLAKTLGASAAAEGTDAKAKVSSLATPFRFPVVDADPLKNARYLEPLAGLNIYFGYGAGRGTGVAPAWLPLA